MTVRNVTMTLDPMTACQIIELKLSKLFYLFSMSIQVGTVAIPNRKLSTEEYRTSLIHTTEHYLQKSTEHNQFTQQNIIYRRVQNIHFITPTSLIHTTEHYLRESTEHH